MWLLLVVARVDTMHVTEWLGRKIEWVVVLRLVEMVASIQWMHC